MRSGIRHEASSYQYGHDFIHVLVQVPTELVIVKHKQRPLSYLEMVTLNASIQPLYQRQTYLSYSLISCSAV